MSNQIGEKVQEMRKQAGLTQEELAYRAGVGLRFLRELEQGKATVRMDKVSQVLEFLGCHLRVEKNGTKK
ncbi:MAG: type II toxin-antitoxin system Y4mF family antitoxin [Candidatus Omnitrophica bacterium]|nr:type II toxin-antitoxin system Y4mF family antitoxin [Candidatus Omnitrophota bacterium]